MGLNSRARLGGLRRVELYGNPGTPEGRAKGGKRTVEIFHKNPADAKGFVLRKSIVYPLRSKELAEFIGIMLGDGGLPGTHQITITLNRKTDREYFNFIVALLKKLFSVDCSVRYRKKGLGIDIVVSSTSLVDFLVESGLTTGSKVRNQASVPDWIDAEQDYRISCLRGLMDTDGGLYRHQYLVAGKKYEYLKLCFTNYSRPLLKFVHRTLEILGVKASLKSNHVSVYSKESVKRYFEIVGSSNPKHLDKFRRTFFIIRGEVPERPIGAAC